MKDIFESIRNTEKDLRSRKLRTFSDDLFIGSEWFRAMNDGAVPELITLPTEVVVEPCPVVGEQGTEAASTEMAPAAVEMPTPKAEIINHDFGTQLKLDFPAISGFDEFRSMIRKCEKCNSLVSQDALLHRFHGMGEVPAKVSVMFVGGSPPETSSNDRAFSEDHSTLLGNMIKAMQIKEGEYITSLALRCQLSSEHGEMTEKIAAICFKNLYQEIFLYRPRVVVGLGALATGLFLGKKERLAVVHGKFFTQTLLFSDQKSVTFQFVPIFHPEFLLLNPNMKKTTWTDLQGIIKFLNN